MLLGVLAMPAMAQERSVLDSASLAEARVRVRMASRERVTGTVVALRADTMVLRTSSTGSTRGLARSEIAGIERSTGARRHRLRGGALGFLGGAGVGAVIGYATASQPACTGSLCFNGLDEGVRAIAGGLVGGVVGTTLGVVIGGRPREQWRQVDGDGAVRVSVRPAPGERVAVSISLRR